jgi:hypothetical protein
MHFSFNPAFSLLPGDLSSSASRLWMTHHGHLTLICLWNKCAQGRIRAGHQPGRMWQGVRGGGVKLEVLPWMDKVFELYCRPVLPSKTVMRMEMSCVYTVQYGSP